MEKLTVKREHWETAIQQCEGLTDSEEDQQKTCEVCVLAQAFREAGFVAPSVFYRWIDAENEGFCLGHGLGDVAARGLIFLSGELAEFMELFDDLRVGDGPCPWPYDEEERVFENPFSKVAVPR